jgi:hypothetical protein
VELPLDSWWYPTAARGDTSHVSGAASRQLVVPHRCQGGGHESCEWSCLSTAGGTPPLPGGGDTSHVSGAAACIQSKALEVLK